MRINFKSKGYATEANALKRIADLGISDLQHFICIQDGRYFPVVRLFPGQTHLIRQIAERDIYVIG